MAHSYPHWKGFERPPRGHLLDEVIDLSRPMGLAYERSVGFQKDLHAHDRPMIILPRGASVVDVRTADGQPYRVGADGGLIVPSRLEHQDQAVSSIFDTLALFPSPSLITSVAGEEGLSQSSVTNLFSRLRQFRRTPWLDRLAQEYVFVRVVSRRESAKTCSFFERQILVEILRVALRQGTPRQPPSSDDDTVAGRALRYIEANLFSALSLSNLSRYSFASPSTLLRHFRKATGKTPYAYAKARRLEEARRLLETGSHSVGDVAMLVGYENFAAFTTAFTRRFGGPPSSFRRARPKVPSRRRQC